VKENDVRSFCGLAAVSLAFWAVPAAAQDVGDFTLLPDILLSAGGGGDGHRINGVGAPSVAWQNPAGYADRYAMVYEVRLPATSPECPVGMWGLGFATSPDGINWTARDTPIVSPVDSTYYSCVAAHPSAIYLSYNDSIMIIWKAEQKSDACDGSPPSWGCGQYTGLGRTQLRFDGSGNIRKITTTTSPVLKRGVDFGFPKLTYITNSYQALVSVRPYIHHISSVNLGAFLFTTVASIQPGIADFAPDEVFNPALACDDNVSFPFLSYFGGKDLGHGVPALIDSAGWGKAISADGNTFFANPDPYFTWTNENDWRHWDVLRVEPSDYLVFYSEKDGTGKPQVRVGATDTLWDPADTYDKICLFP
jgi:hypothetical protein